MLISAALSFLKKSYLTISRRCLTINNPGLLVKKYCGEDSLAAGDFKRKLTAILSAVHVGYFRLMGEDEAVKFKTLET